jgi:hypothetical protein
VRRRIEEKKANFQVKILLAEGKESEGWIQSQATEQELLVPL